MPTIIYSRFFGIISIRPVSTLLSYREIGALKIIVIINKRKLLLIGNVLVKHNPYRR